MKSLLSYMARFLGPLEIVFSARAEQTQGSLQPTLRSDSPGQGGSSSLERATHLALLAPQLSLLGMTFSVRQGQDLYAPVLEARSVDIGATRDHWEVLLVGPNPYRDTLALPVFGSLETDPTTGNRVQGVSSIITARVRLIVKVDPLQREEMGADLFQQRLTVLWDPTNPVALESVPWGVRIEHILAGQPGHLTLEQPYPAYATDKARVYGLKFEALWERR